MKPITKEHFSNWEKSNQETQQLEEIITERIGYVVEVWMKTFGGKLTHWYFGDDEGNRFIDYIDDNNICSISRICNPNTITNDKYDMVIVTKDGGEWAWDGSIPLRWLFEDCEEEIIKGKFLYDERLKKKQEDTLLQDSLKEKVGKALVAQAKAKLSKEELAALLNFNK